MSNPSPRKLLEDAAQLAIRYREKLDSAPQKPQSEYPGSLDTFLQPVRKQARMRRM